MALCKIKDTIMRWKKIHECKELFTKSGVQRTCGIGDITLFICHDAMLHKITWSKNHATLCMVAHEPCKNRDITFFTRHATIVSRYHCGWCPLLISHHHFKLSGHGPTEVEIFLRFLFVTWAHVTLWTEGHVTLKFVTPYHKPPSCID